MRNDREANFIKRISRSGCPERGDQSLSDGRRMEIEWVTDGQTNNQIICLWLLLVLGRRNGKKILKRNHHHHHLIPRSPPAWHVTAQHTRATSRTGGRRLDFKNNTRDRERERPPTLYLHTLLASCSNSSESQCKKTHKNKKDISTNLAFFDTISDSRPSQLNFFNPFFSRFDDAQTRTDHPHRTLPNDEGTARVAWDSQINLITSTN